MLTQKEMVSMYGPVIRRRGKQYRKSVVVEARPANVGEVVETVIDGKKETSNVAKEGYVVVTNPTGECYIMRGEKFHGRYKHLDGNKYKATGKIMGLVASEELAEKVPEFEASWGEPMILEEGDILAMPVDGDPEVYRIEKGVFAKTYEEDDDA